MKIYKIFICLFFIILLSFSPVLADDENFEYLSDLSTIQSSNSENITEPTINSRAAIVYERSSGKILYGKEEYIKNIIVADLKSDDKTKEIAKKMSEDYEQLKVISWKECKDIIDNLDQP